jgi:murein L,D-transpeptidase YcbB/YkuD
MVLLGCAEGAQLPVSRAGDPSSSHRGAVARPIDSQTVAAAIHARLGQQAGASIDSTSFDERTELRRLYEARAYAPLWLNQAGRTADAGWDALRLLRNAPADGLDPAAYGVDRLTALASQLEAEPGPAPGAATFDVDLSTSVLRYLRHLHLGQIDPRAVGLNLYVRVDEHDFVTILLDAVARHQVADLASAMAPPLVQYRLLRATLARYRSLLETSPGEAPHISSTLRPGERHAELPNLIRSLIAFGDLPATTVHASDGYDQAIVEGVKRFQVRHGLEPDGVIGKTTQAALQIPVSRRARQIELALERLRWLPDLGSQRFVALNIPMFHLWGWDAIPPSGEPAFGMRTIVGRALRTQTPVFVDEMRSVIFRPYWNVPPSILRNEIIPVLERDPDYLRRQNMEIVLGQGDDARPVAATRENIARLRQGTLRLRQRPGPRNALGLVKFVFPNDDNVYFHGTPAQELFARARRDFSHGCVRVEDPVALAEWVLKEQPEWTRERILAAMSGSATRQVNLSRPIQVILFYTTAAVMPDDGTVRFADDIYGHDATLERHLEHTSRLIR